jgi:hypothetical protein
MVAVVVLGTYTIINSISTHSLAPFPDAFASSIPIYFIRLYTLSVNNIPSVEILVKNARSIAVLHTQPVLALTRAARAPPQRYAASPISS